VVFGFPGFSTLAMQSAPASHGAVIGGILPLATAVAGVVLAHEHPPWRFWIAGLVGSVALVAYALRDGFALHLADVWLVLAVISAAIGYAEGGRLARHLGGWTVIAWALVLSLPIALPLACFTAPPVAAWTPWALGGMTYLALISQLLAFVAWYRGLALGGIARVGQLQLLQPFVTIAASVWLFSEQVTWPMVATLLIVLGSVAVGRGSLRR
jgi:drug/metabolite transporter (DMT)-like permease